MNNDLKDILANSNKDIDNQELLNYLSNHLSQAKNHEIEKALADDDFMNDAVEGLQQLKNNDIPFHLEKLNEGLLQQLGKKKERKKRRWKDNPQTYLIIVIILLLLMLCYVIVKRNSKTATGLQIRKSSTEQSVSEKSR